MARMGMAIDLDRCVGCGACVLACKSEWQVADGEQRTWVTEIGPVGRFPDGLESTFYVGQCAHCGDPICVAACPTGAMAKDSDGRVLVEPGLCIGCRYCVAACPYGACFIDPRTGKVDKCDFCYDRMRAGAAEPACVQTCISEAKVFGDLDDPASGIRQRLDEAGSRRLVTGSVDIDPNLHFVGSDHHVRLILEHHPPIQPITPMSRLAPYGLHLLGGTALVLALFHWLVGPLRPSGEGDDAVVPRFRLSRRITHWLLVVLTLFLALTGLILLYGGPPLQVLIGDLGFAAVASAAKEMHNLFGPLFAVSLLGSLLIGARDNLFQSGDWHWLLRGGGLYRSKPLAAGRFNAGEKVFFWLTIGFGAILTVSGFLLGFPVFGQGRVTMEIAHTVHGVAAILFLVLLAGHAYLGSLGGDGVLSGMTRGVVRADWARTFHRRWFDAFRQGEASEDRQNGATPRC